MKYDELKTGMLINCNSYFDIFYISSRIDKFGNIRVSGIELNDPYMGEVSYSIDEHDFFHEIHKIGTKEYSAALIKIFNKRNEAKLDAEKDCLLIQGFLGNSNISNTGGGGGVDEKLPNVQNQSDSELS